MENENRNANDEAPQPPSEMEPEGFQVEMVGPSRKRSWILAGVVTAAVLFLVGSVISSSGVMDAWLPWTQEYAQRRVPAVPDGGEPIALLKFDQERGEDAERGEATITVTGRVLNRTEGKSRGPRRHLDPDHVSGIAPGSGRAVDSPEPGSLARRARSSGRIR